MIQRGGDLRTPLREVALESADRVDRIAMGCGSLREATADRPYEKLHRPLADEGAPVEDFAAPHPPDADEKFHEHETHIVLRIEAIGGGGTRPGFGEQRRRRAGCIVDRDRRLYGDGTRKLGGIRERELEDMSVVIDRDEADLAFARGEHEAPLVGQPR
jgi:hypothetical protein